MDHPKGILIDIDGVLLQDGSPIDGTINKLNTLKEHYKIRLLTNTTTEPVSAIQTRLTSHGFLVEEKDIINAPLAAVSALKQLGLHRIHPIVNKRILSDFSEFEQDVHAPEAIIIGDIGDAWDHSLLNTLFTQVMEGASIIALHKGKYWKKEGKLKLDIGLFVAGLEYATGKEALVAGKPSGPFFDAALQSLDLPAEDVVMIGDDIENDVDGAQRKGIKSFLVQTGKYNQDFVERSNIKPYRTIRSFNDFSLFG